MSNKAATAILNFVRDYIRTVAVSLALLCVLALVHPQSLAQVNGTLSGKVRDSSGGAVAGAKVLLVNTASGARRSTVTNSDGIFNIPAIQYGTFNVKIIAPGFDALTVTGVTIDAGDVKVLQNLTLKLGRVDTEVQVTADAAGLALDSPEKGSLITADDIKRLSTVGRDVTELIKTLPGFAVSTGGGLQNQSTNNGAQTMGFGSSSVSSFSANGATPQTGATSVISDGANVMDPGDMGASISNVNMDMVAEVKVETSNFGADSAKGPVVINAVGKSGGAEFHGSAYMFARNGVLNSNDWLANYTGVQRPPSSYYYPGANIGGPVLIPGTNFNRSKKMTFFSAFEFYGQRAFDQLALSFIPTPRMLGGDLTPASIGAALGVDASVVTTQCPAFYSSGTLPNSGGFCYSPGLASKTYTQQDQQIVAGSVVGSGSGLLPVDPRAAVYAQFWPKPNRQPLAGNGLASDGFNYADAVTSTHNGFQLRERVDENFNDNNKLYLTYNYEKINDESPVTDAFYAGSDIIPYPNPAYSNARSDSAAINYTKIIGASITNELVVTGTYFYEPQQLQNRSQVLDSNTGWSGGRFYNNNALQLPGIIDYEEGVPDFAMAYFPSNSKYLRKFSYNGADNFSKQYRSHSLKFGVYAEETANNQVPYNYTQGQNTFNHYNYGCTTNDGLNNSQLYNNVANFLQGCTGFNQASGSPAADMNFKTLAFYATDDWKATNRLTLTLGLRVDHLGPWVDAHGNGLAVWNAPAQHVLTAGITQDPRTYPGISWHQTDSKIPLSGAPSTFAFVSPRAGLAYDLYGNGKTIFRGGWGAYRFHDSYNDAAGALNTSIGVQTYTVPSNLNCTYDQIAFAGSNTGAGHPGQNCVSTNSGGLNPFSVYALDPKDSEQPVTYNYNFTVDQVLPHDMKLEFGYVGNQSRHTLTAGNLSNQNYIPLGSLFQPDPLTGQVSYPGAQQQVIQDYRPYPNYVAVYVPSHVGYGNYNAMQASINKQKGAFIFGLNYTWGKALGIRSDYRTGAVGDPSTLRNNYGYLGFNRTEAANLTFSYQEGNRYHGSRLLRLALNQWALSGITTLQSGPDTAVLSGSTNYGLGGGVTYTPSGSATPIQVPISNITLLGTPDINLQPVITCDPKYGLHNSTLGRQYINPNCFKLPALGSNGNFELPDITGPAYFDTDLTVQKDFNLPRKQSLEFRLAGFNFINHPMAQFYGPNVLGLFLAYGSPTINSAHTAADAFAGATQNSINFGYTPYKGGYRIVELSARYTF
ncbi:MAG: TonB-dependent receptor [Acidobacteria bacterium]|nr:TonB-dependent receptor [Acidobacteriota bacterium]